MSPDSAALEANSLRTRTGNREPICRESSR
jgi:hypothetical protein